MGAWTFRVSYVESALVAGILSRLSSGIFPAAAPKRLLLKVSILERIRSMLDKHVSTQQVAVMGLARTHPRELPKTWKLPGHYCVVLSHSTELSDLCVQPACCGRITDMIFTMLFKTASIVRCIDPPHAVGEPGSIVCVFMGSGTGIEMPC